MENLQVIAANMIYAELEAKTLDDPYSAVEWVMGLPEDFERRDALFRLVEIPTHSLTYTYLLCWLDYTPPKIHHFERLVENAIEPHLLERMQAGEVVGYRPVWRADFWALEQIA